MTCWGYLACFDFQEPAVSALGQCFGRGLMGGGSTGMYPVLVSPGPFRSPVGAGGWLGWYFPGIDGGVLPGGLGGLPRVAIFIS
jgi:hypothetical protein